MTTAIIGIENYKVELSNGKLNFLSDEPMDIGGGELGPSPDELLEAALGSCTAITLRMYAVRKGWPVEKIEVSVKLQRTGNKTLLTRDINITGDVSDEQKTRLLQIAKACPVSKTLEGEVELQNALRQ